MEIATYKNDVWGREVFLGVSWDLLWLVIVAAFVVIVVHALVYAMRRREAKPSSEGRRVTRHEKADRIFHWLMAASVFALLITGVFPKIGIEFGWLTIHWVAGLVLTGAVVYHVVRAFFWQNAREIMISGSDLSEPFDENKKPGKYSLAQKSMHGAVTVVTLVVIATGLVMFAMIDTPWWDRTNALEESTLGWMFLLHGLSTLALVGLIALHVYFGLRPEKLFYTRSMIKGWISEDELKAHHDPNRWAPKESA
jgi:formate dehydrogenase subunit gamma